MNSRIFSRRLRGLRRCLIFAFVAIPTFAQTFKQRGFLETGGTFYPQAALNDSAKAIGESLFRYEAFYNPSSALQIAGAFDLRADTHRQVERRLHISWWDRELQRPAAEVRRLSATFHRRSLTFEAGKQFVRWGKTDIVTPTDRFAPRDFLTVVDNDFLAVTAARLTVERGSNSIEAVWSPRLTPSRIPLANDRWSTPGFPRPALVKTQMPGGGQSGVRWNHNGAVELELSLYEGFNHVPSFQYLLNRGAAGVELHKFYPKTFMGGADVAVPTALFTIKGEAAQFTSTDARADDYALYVIQLERQQGEWTFVGGYAGEAITQRGSAIAFSPDRGLTKTLLGRASYTIDANRTVAFEGAARQDGAGVWLKTEYSQAFGQHWRATLNGTLIHGAVDDFLGQYRRNSHALVVLRYSF